MFLDLEKSWQIQKNPHTREILMALEQVRGIEPPSRPWQGRILPLNDTCKYGGPDEARTRGLLRDRETC